MIKKIEEKIPIPINKDGTFDLEKQQEIAQKYEQVLKVKRLLGEKIDCLLNKEILFT